MSSESEKHTDKHPYKDLFDADKQLTEALSNQSSIMVLADACKGKAGEENGPFTRFFVAMLNAHETCSHNSANVENHHRGRMTYANLYTYFLDMIESLPPGANKRFKNMLIRETMTMSDLAEFCEIAVEENNRVCAEISQRLDKEAYSVALLITSMATA